MVRKLNIWDFVYDLSNALGPFVALEVSYTIQYHKESQQFHCSVQRINKWYLVLNKYLYQMDFFEVYLSVLSSFAQIIKLNPRHKCNSITSYKAHLQQNQSNTLKFKLLCESNRPKGIILTENWQKIDIAIEYVKSGGVINVFPYKNSLIPDA